MYVCIKDQIQNMNLVIGCTEQAHAQDTRVFWKEDLAPIMGEEPVQELPDAYYKVLEEQRKWHK